MSPPGVTVAPHPGSGPAVELGPVKVLLDDVGLPTFDELATRIRDAHGAGRSVAVHLDIPDRLGEPSGHRPLGDRSRSGR